MHVLLIIPFAIISYLVATDIYTPSMPAIAEQFASTSDGVQKTLTFFLAGAVSSCLVAGYLADRFGKTRVSVYGALIAVGGALLCFLAPTLELLIAGRFILGVGGAVAPVVGMSILQERLTEEQAFKIFGFMGAAFSIIPATAPILGGYVDVHLGWQVNFLIIFGMMLVSLIGLYFFLEPSGQKKIGKVSPSSKISFVQGYKEVLSHKTFLAYALLNPILFAGEWALLSFMPFYAERAFQMDSDAYGLFLGGLIFWYGIGSFLGGRLSKKFGIDTTIYLGILMSLIGTLSLVILIWVLPEVGILLVYGTLSLFFGGFGILFPASVPKALSVFTTLKSTASSVRGVLVTFVGLLGTYAAELMDESNLSHLSVFMFLISVLALASFVGLKASQK